MLAPARSSQSELFLSFSDNVLRLRSSLVILLILVPPGVVTPGRFVLRDAKLVLDLLLGRPSFVNGFLREMREEDLERTEGVVGADRPSR